MKEFKRPEGYTNPYYTSAKVAEMLGLSTATVVRKREKMATEVVPGTFFWSDEDAQKLAELDPRPGRKDVYKSSKWYKGDK